MFGTCIASVVDPTAVCPVMRWSKVKTSKPSMPLRCDSGVVASNLLGPPRCRLWRGDPRSWRPPC
eukprot:1136740-Pyramimonas_sp.AAC.1